MIPYVSQDELIAMNNPSRVSFPPIRNFRIYDQK
jgi:hypothetical protein